MEKLEFESDDVLLNRVLFGRLFALFAANSGDPIAFISSERQKSKELVHTAVVRGNKASEALVSATEAEIDKFFGQFFVK